MKSFIEFISDILNETTYNKIKGLQKPLNRDLIKLITYEDNINQQKYINEIMDRLEQIQDIDFGKKNKKFSKDLYFKLLFEEPFTDDNIFKNYESIGSLKEYSNLPRKKTELETTLILEKIQKEISSLLSRNEIYDIEFELKKL